MGEKMENKTLILSHSGVDIRGKYYTVSNGFVTKEDSTVHLRNSDLLSVELVKRRSKKAMYVVLILGCVLISVLLIIRAEINSLAKDALKIANAQNMQEVYRAAKDTYEMVQDAHGGNYNKRVIDGIKAILAILIVLVALVSICGAVYLFSGRRFVELTTMRGTYRVRIKRGDNEIKDIVTQLRGRL